MLSPLSFLDHADRLLGDSPTETDHRRAISATYYAVFHLLSSEAASVLSAALPPGLASTLRRSAQHRDMRRVCDAVANGITRDGAALYPEPISLALRSVARTFVLLQVKRHEADYDFEANSDLIAARLQGAAARRTFELWATIHDEPNSKLFLAALLLSDKWIFRG